MNTETRERIEAIAEGLVGEDIKVFRSLVHLAAYAESLLRPELDALERLRDAAEGFPRVASAGKVPDKYVFYGRANGYGETTDAEITPAGLARIREIEELLK